MTANRATDLMAGLVTEPATMRLWAMDALGRNSLHQSTVPVPTPVPGQVLVKVAAVSLNYRDKLVIESGMGLPLKFPFVPGSDMAGTVVRAGDTATRFKVGDRVISTFRPGWIDGAPSGTASVPPYDSLGGIHPGVLAEYVCFPDAWFSSAPDTLDDAEASTLPCAGLTAWFALVEQSRLHPGQTVVVQGTGGVALFGLQIARAHGADVIVLSAARKSSRAPRRLERRTSSTVRGKTGCKPSTASPATAAPTTFLNWRAGLISGVRSKRWRSTDASRSSVCSTALPSRDPWDRCC